MSSRLPGPARPKEQLLIFRLQLVSLCLWAAALAYLSLAADVKTPSGPLGWDKLHHFAAYAVLALLLLPVLTARRKPTAFVLAAAWLACSAYGFLLEGLQGLMGLGRQWEVGDLLANSLGALATCVVFRLCNGRSCKP